MKRSVLPVGKKKQDERVSTPLPEAEKEEVVSEASVAQPTVGSGQPEMPFDLDGVDPEKIGLAEAAGVPVRKLMAWANSVELRLQLIQEGMPETIKNAMNQWVEEARKKAMGQAQSMPQQGGSGLGGLPVGQILQLLSGSGSGMDEEMLQIVKDTMKSNIDFTNAVKNAIVGKITAKAIGETLG